MTAEKGEVTLNDLSRQLGLKMPTVNSMIKKLADKKLVHYVTYKPLRLTEKGKKVAALIIRKHRLTEMFLVEKMGFGWESVHSIAEQIEHIQSEELFAKMDALLGYPKTDPHGSPIPDKNGEMEWVEYTHLSDCKKGDTVHLAAVTLSSDEFLRFLNTRSLHLGVKLIVKNTESFDGSMTVSYSGHKSEVLSKTVCEKMLVKRPKKNIR